MKNNKGFMLAEVVITSTIVLTALISFYTTFNKLYKRYEIHSTYYDIDGVYAIKELGNILLEEGDINKIITNMNLSSNEYTKIECNTSFNSDKEKKSCNGVKDLYNIENMYIINNYYSSIMALKNTTINNTFKDYLDYIIKRNSDLKLNNENAMELYRGTSQYLIIIEYKGNNDSDDYKYSYLEFGGPRDESQTK